jgi:hypothetical protein
MLKFLLTEEEFGAVDEALKGQYKKQDDGSYQLEIDGLAGDPKSLQKAVRDARKDADAAKARLKALEEQFSGVDLEEIKKLREEQEQREQDALTKAGEWDKLKGQMNEAHAKALQRKDEEAAVLRKALETHLIDAQATSAISTAKGSTLLLLPHVKSHTKVVQENGQYRVQVVDDTGSPRVDASGNPLSIAQLIEEMKKAPDYQRAFEGSGASGGGGGDGSSNGNGDAAGRPPANQGNLLRSKMNIDQKSAYIAEHGEAKFLQIPW